jgi:hypothetical protein
MKILIDVEKPSDEESQKVKDWVCATTGHTLDMEYLWADQKETIAHTNIICRNCKRRFALVEI